MVLRILAVTFLAIVPYVGLLAHGPDLWVGRGGKGGKGGKGGARRSKVGRATQGWGWGWGWYLAGLLLFFRRSVVHLSTQARPSPHSLSLLFTHLFCPPPSTTTATFKSSTPHTHATKAISVCVDKAGSENSPRHFIISSHTHT